MTNLLLVNGGCGEKDDFCEPTMREWSITDPADDLVPAFTDSQTLLIGIVDKASYVLSRHHRELLLKKCLEICKNNERPRLIVIVHWDDLNDTSPQFNGRCLLWFDWRLKRRREIDPSGTLSLNMWAQCGHEWGHVPLS